MLRLVILFVYKVGDLLLSGQYLKVGILPKKIGRNPMNSGYGLAND